MSTSQPTCLLSEPLSGRDRRCSTLLKISEHHVERCYATRAKSHKVEVSGASHSVYVSRPKEVGALIEEAAAHGRQKTL